MRILIIEDQEKLANSVKRGLENIGYAADIVQDGPAALRRVLASPDNFDLILLDVMLPNMDGITICKNIRNENINIPILMLTAKDTLEDKVLGLNTGADDYIVKPFEFSELTARVRALLRRPREVLKTELSGANITLNTIDHSVSKNDKNVKLTLKEFSILEIFMRNQNKLLNTI